MQHNLDLFRVAIFSRILRSKFKRFKIVAYNLYYKKIVTSFGLVNWGESESLARHRVG